MDPLTTITATAPLWEGLGTRLITPVGHVLADAWKNMKWDLAEAEYRRRVSINLGTTRLLGNSRPIYIDKIFTDVYVLDTPSARRTYSTEAIEELSYEDLYTAHNKNKLSALEVQRRNPFLYVLGKPGAGKTTFLKYLAIQAANGGIPSTPVFVPMREWAASSFDLMRFLEKLFDICNFPEGRFVVETLLKEGRLLLLFDGLDEVTQVEQKRQELVSAIVDLAKKYPKNQICVTCRTAADAFTFEQFTYVEIADFDELQQLQFARKWYSDAEEKHSVFVEEWRRPRNRGLRDLAATPLLLALLCLAFDETLRFPIRRVDLYTEAIDALLRRWDSSRNIFRDTPYKELSPSRKEQLLSRLAAETFQEKRYAFRPNGVATCIKKYMESLPAPEAHADVHIDSVLRAIEAQHGLVVERARGIFSFSHLTFHEYFTASYIVENADKGSVAKLLRPEIASDPRWREVIVLTASLLHSADTFFDKFVSCVRDYVKSRAPLRDLLQKVNLLACQPQFMDEKVVLQRVESTPEESRSRLLRDIISVMHGHTGKFEELPLRRAYALLAITEGMSYPDIPHSISAIGLVEFCRMNHLMAECLRVASVSERRLIEMRLLSPT